ncbi:amidase [Amycolatopsis cihanbeyliensis]|uniref:Aspartyl-tRNA(Asn)/glutamyl-tRNA(Gln) amidotransferase subunit A n=1 Tax=Amycolatopsis cihanbeyliensis TaxID=1128664 RepID=A0A542DQD5_AMYCI|nr:amidase [Amycolatopsis cihanbeyliensis]TQJ05318.1 aspartyl-tRNA(Asn)/glutamyl-tRNA(Gln) amidotransferase subunit A [Amycolatopsis cihanbeyliensis]
MNDNLTAATEEERLLLAPIRTVGDLLESGAVSPVELTEAALGRIERLDPGLQAFAHVAGEQALDAARAAAERIAGGRRRGPLDGIVVAVKDCAAVRELPLEAGSAVLRGNIAGQDAATVTALKAAGAIIVGKTTLDEFTLTTVGPARNPLDGELTAGGSSGGSAVAVRAGLCSAALGTDTGGSVRIPAECCGITGLKPTHGLLPTEGIIPLAPSLDHPGVLARSVADTALVLEALLPARPSGLDAALTGGENRYRIGVPAGLDCDPAAWQAFCTAVEHARGRGAEVSTVELPDLEQLGQAHWTILSSELATYHLRRFGTEEDRYQQPMRDAIAAGSAVTVADYLAAQEQRGRLRARVNELLDGVDLLAMPTLTCAVPRRDAAADPTAAMVRLTSLFNHTGHPALSVPPSTATGDRPAGIQLVGRHFTERALLAAADTFVQLL